MIRFDVDENEAQLIINALAEMPHRLVASLVPRLIASAEAQLHPMGDVPADRDGGPYVDAGAELAASTNGAEE